MNGQIKDDLLKALDDLKALNPKAYDVIKIVSYADWVLVVSGTSTTHIAALIKKAEETMATLGYKPIGIEGDKGGNGWVLIDFGDLVLHVMSEEKRDFYQLEKLFLV